MCYFYWLTGPYFKNVPRIIRRYNYNYYKIFKNI